MPLEQAQFISDLVPSNPAGSDGLSQADDHLRLIKAVLQGTLGGTGQLVDSTGILAVQSDGTQATTGSDGTAVAPVPALTFASDKTTGFYKIRTGVMAFAGSLFGQGTAPVGALVLWAGPDTTIPTGWMACDGALVSRSTFPELFAAIGTTWGQGDGSTTFALPNFTVGRYARHRDNATVSGATGTRQDASFADHVHGVSIQSGTESTSHIHPLAIQSGGQSVNHTHPYGVFPFAGQVQITGGGGGAVSGEVSMNTGGASNDHSHLVAGNTSTENALHTHLVSGNTAGAASGQGAETRPISATVCYIIRVS